MISGNTIVDRKALLTLTSSAVLKDAFNEQTLAIIISRSDGKSCPLAIHRLLEICPRKRILSLVLSELSAALLTNLVSAIESYFKLKDDTFFLKLIEIITQDCNLSSSIKDKFKNKTIPQAKETILSLINKLPTEISYAKQLNIFSTGHVNYLLCIILENISFIYSQAGVNQSLNFLGEYKSVYHNLLNNAMMALVVASSKDCEIKSVTDQVNKIISHSRTKSLPSIYSFLDTSGSVCLNEPSSQAVQHLNPPATKVVSPTQPLFSPPISTNDEIKIQTTTRRHRFLSLVEPITLFPKAAESIDEEKQSPATHTAISSLPVTSQGGNNTNDIWRELKITKELTIADHPTEASSTNTSGGLVISYALSNNQSRIPQLPLFRPKLDTEENIDTNKASTRVARAFSNDMKLPLIQTKNLSNTTMP